jgi:hypothetical protein
MQSRIQRPVFDLENILGTVLNGVRDGVTVGRAKDQRPENQQIESSLKHFTLQGRFAAWHVLQYTPVGDLLEFSLDYAGDDAIICSDREIIFWCTGVTARHEPPESAVACGTSTGRSAQL